MPICDEEGKKEAAANWDTPCETNSNEEQSNGPPEIDWGNKWRMFLREMKTSLSRLHDNISFIHYQRLKNNKHLNNIYKAGISVNTWNLHQENLMSIIQKYLQCVE